MTRKTYLIAATAALVAMPLMAGTTFAQRASKPGAVENTESGASGGSPGSSSDAPARSMRPPPAPDSAKPGAPAATGAPKKTDDKKGEEKKK